jgi:hypothetical protein
MAKHNIKYGVAITETNTKGDTTENKKKQKK